MFSQSLRISGNINDTTTKTVLPNALLMAIKFNDSTLINYTRTNKDGIFKPITLPVDTYIVIISHPNFNDKTYLLVPNKNDSVFKFKNVVLPPKSVQLNEVEIIAYKDKMYYKGDTLQFTADSFKTKANATVEDLLKKLPGIKVDAAGKITIQGKTVDQVLVDGDEFFGSDPTIATKNLNANTVETVQVFDKKTENTEGGGDETVKVVNLKLKEDSKKGYFGKVSTAADPQEAPDGTFPRFYENDILVNRFKKNQKISLFGLFANTPKQAFGWRDANQYGLSNESGGNYDPETNSWTGFNQPAAGVPQTLKSGFYFNDRYGKNTKVNTDYTFRQGQLVSGSETNTQFFLQDTSYTNKQVIGKTTQNQDHTFNFRLTQKLDSLTELTIRPKLNYNTSSFSNSQADDFISQSGELTRQTNILNSGASETTDLGLQVKLAKNFMKKDRLLTFNYMPSYYDSKTNNDLNTDFKYFNNQLPDSSLLQKRTHINHRQEQSGSISFIEPFTKKIKTEVSYGFTHNLNNNNRTTLDFNGQAFDVVNTAQSNDFRNTRVTHRVGAKFIYDVKKYRFSFGTNYRNIYQENINASINQKLHRTFDNVLPFANVNFRINQGSNFTIFYHTQAQQPDLQQMQPVVDNSDPNRISIGNPDLKPQFSNNLSLNYYFYKGISDVDFYAGSNFIQTSNDITEKSIFDSLGRSVSTPLNVNGNYNGNLWCGGGVPIFKRFFKIHFNFSGSINNNVGFINEEKNITQTMGFYPGINIEKELDWLEARIGGNYNYNITKQTISLQSIQPYYSYGLEGNVSIKFPKKFKLSVNGDYTNNGNRASGYNLNFFILSGSVSKTFFKNESLTISIEGNDILNQNISNQRNIMSNKIIDTKTQIIKRYFLLRVLYKFTSQKTKKDEEEDDD